MPKNNDPIEPLTGKMAGVWIDDDGNVRFKVEVLKTGEVLPGTIPTRKPKTDNESEPDASR